MRACRVTACRIVLGAVAATPYRCLAAEKLLTGNSLSSEVIARVAEAAVSKASPLEHNGFKVALAQQMVVRALEELQS